MQDIAKLREYDEKGYIIKELFNWKATKDAPKEVQELLDKIKELNEKDRIL